MRLILCVHGASLLHLGMKHGWWPGKQLPGLVWPERLHFADQDWKKPNRPKYMAALAKHTPHMATVMDWETEEQFDEVMSWAEEASQYVQQVIIIPKVHGGIPRLPKHINGKDVVLGYSVPTLFGGSETMLQEFRGRMVHLLGGSPHKQMQTFLHLAPIADVISVDGNMAAKLCFKGLVWQGRTFVQDTEKHDGHGLILFERSCKNIIEAWQQLTDIDVCHDTPCEFKIPKRREMTRAAARAAAMPVIEADPNAAYQTDMFAAVVPADAVVVPVAEEQPATEYQYAMFGDE